MERKWLKSEEKEEKKKQNKKINQKNQEQMLKFLFKIY